MSLAGEIAAARGDRWAAEVHAWAERWYDAPAMSHRSALRQLCLADERIAILERALAGQTALVTHRAGLTPAEREAAADALAGTSSRVVTVRSPLVG